MGCKGIIMHDPTLDAEGEILVLRKSQQKFEWNMNTIKGVKVRRIRHTFIPRPKILSRF